MQTKLAKISDIIFIYLILFLISFVWCTQHSSNIKICFISAIIISIILNLTIIKIFQIRKNKKTIKLNEEKLIRKIETTLMFFNQNELINYFFNIINIVSKNATKFKTHILANNLHIIPIFNKHLDTQDYLKIFKSFKKKNVIILTNKLSNELETLLSTLEINNIKILTINEVYFNLIKPTNILPTEIVKEKTFKKIKMQEIICNALNKKNSKKYFYFGLTLMLLSFVYRFSLYYQITGTLLLILSLISRFNKSFNSHTENNIFSTEKNTE